MAVVQKGRGRGGRKGSKKRDGKKGRDGRGGEGGEMISDGDSKNKNFMGRNDGII